MAKLQAAVALLPDLELSNRLAAAALCAHGASLGRLRWPLLPAHLSLKQPFEVDALQPVDEVIDELARELAPLRASFGALEVQPPSPGTPEAVVWVGVETEPALLALEQRIEHELPAFAAASSAPLGSAAYRHHVTLGFLPAPSFDASAALPSLAGSSGTFGELGVFVYEGLPRAGWQCLLYARRALSRAFVTPVVPSSR